MPPDRPLLIRCRIGKIRHTVGYAPRQTFEHTLGELIQLAASAALPGRVSSRHTPTARSAT
jgi:hypothetical protein